MEDRGISTQSRKLVQRSLFVPIDRSQAGIIARRMISLLAACRAGMGGDVGAWFIRVFICPCHVYNFRFSEILIYAASAEIIATAETGKDSLHLHLSLFVPPVGTGTIFRRLYHRLIYSKDSERKNLDNNSVQLAQLDGCLWGGG